MVNIYYADVGLVLRRDVWNPLDITAGVQSEGDKAKLHNFIPIIRH